jgi:cation diffusion facilitator CzcD-associated flavoprotein CzcO
MWVTSFKDFPYSKEQDVNDGKILGEEMLCYVNKFGKEKNLMDAYTFNSQVVEINYSTKESTREATLVLKDSQSGMKWTEGPFDLVIYASQASEPRIPDIPGRKDFKGKVYHSTEFKKEQYDEIVQNEKKVVVVGGSKAGCDLALCFQRSGYDKFRWLYRKPYLFFKYELFFFPRPFPP